MISTRITETLDIDTPICSAGMAFVGRPALAAAVSNSGGLGGLGCDMNPPEGLQAMVRETRSLTSRPISVDIVGDFLTSEHIDVCIAERVEVVVFFWTMPTAEQVAPLKAGGTQVWVQVGSVAEALEAAALEVDAIIAQGSEAGGHNRAEATTMTLLPAIIRAVAPLPVVAAGGITDGRGLAAALCLGAEAVWCGTRFLASSEAFAHDEYKARVVAAGVGNTVRTDLFGREWPFQMERVIRNRTVDEWGDRASEAMATPAGEPVGTTVMGGQTVPIPSFSAALPTPETEGDFEQFNLTAGEGCGNIEQVLPAADIVHRMTQEAVVVLSSLSEVLARGRFAETATPSG